MSPLAADDFRALVLPRALVMVSASPASTKCLSATAEAAVRAREARRAAAAADAAIRARGLTPLTVGLGYGQGAVRQVSRGPNGERWMYWIADEGCTATPPTVAMTADHRIVGVALNYTVRRTRTLSACSQSCNGSCGAAQQFQWVVEVPADAVASKNDEQVEVAMDVQVEVVLPRADPMACAMP